MKVLIDSWYCRKWWRFLLLPLSCLYRIIVASRRFAYQSGWLTVTDFSVPVIVVGNISVGGTGKTPMVILLAQYLKQQGWRPGIVSRGYGGDNQVARIVTASSQAALVGDEALLIQRRSQSPMVICRSRVAAVKKLLENSDCNVVIADDGLQHYAMARDIEIAMIDGKRGLGNRHLLPAGPLREPTSRLDSVDFVVVNGKYTANTYYHISMQQGLLYRLDNPQQQQALSTFSSKTVHALAGIGNPERFFDSLRQQGVQIIPHTFADHHAFCSKDIDFDDDYPIIMTEKDAVKCQAFSNQRHWCLPISALSTDNLLSDVLSKLNRC